VREALIRLEARGIVEVTPRRGWFVVEPSLDEARDVFQARCALETGILRSIPSAKPAVEILRHHISQEREAIAAHDAAERSYLLGDFHVCMMEALGNRVLADILRDLTARTVLISALYQSNHQAAQSCDEHQLITDALAAGDMNLAADLMAAHIGHVEAGLTERACRDPLMDLRNALQLTNQIAGATRYPGG
jgi:DNA-binding GntR family transcriptional regulator